MRACSASASIAFSSLAFSTKAREVMTVPMPGRHQAGLHVADAGGEIQHRRHPAEGLQRKEGDDGRVDVGQQHADMLAAPRQLGQRRAQRQGAEQQLRVADRGAGGVLDGDEAAAMDGTGATIN